MPFVFDVGFFKMEKCLIVRNIPKTLHSKDLRDFFSEYTESSKFKCFHFLHRAEQDFTNKFELHPPPNQNMCCCVLKIDRAHAEDFTKMYHNKQWSVGSPVCFVQPFLETQSKNCLAGGVSLDNLPECNPPPVMPNGNVGTPTTVFLEEIRLCKLPTSIIAKLGLKFPKASGRKYANVQYTYEDSKGRNEVDHSDSNEDADSCEEFERHEALCDDPSNQERLAERLYEEPLEVVWDKGGSGLVFYTDAQHWDELAGDFDDKTADDHDVDMSVYYEGWEAGDLDARQRIEMAESDRLYAGMYSKDRDARPPGKTARSKASARNRSRSPIIKSVEGFGKQMLQLSGWKPGQGLGRSAQGIKVPIEADGQSPRNRIGFGYRGAKIDLQAAVTAAKEAATARQQPRLIATIYDKPGKDPGLYRRNDHYQLHTRQDPSLPSSSAKSLGTPGMTSTDYR